MQKMTLLPLIINSLQQFEIVNILNFNSHLEHVKAQDILSRAFELQTFYVVL